MRIVSVCGSFGSTSANRAALDVANGRLRTRGVVELADVRLEHVPMFDPALVDDAPPPVVDMRSLLEGADGVLLAAPEYAGGVAGGIKNALDWLVGSASIHHRPFVVLSAGTTGGVFAIEQLVRTLSWQGALVVRTLGIDAPRTKMNEKGFVDTATIAAIEQSADDLVAAISAGPAALLERVAAVVTPFGIDPGRFGDLS